jgi:hypothetical protein
MPVRGTESLPTSMAEVTLMAPSVPGVPVENLKVPATGAAVPPA